MSILIVLLIFVKLVTTAPFVGNFFFEQFDFPKQVDTIYDSIAAQYHFSNVAPMIEKRAIRSIIIPECFFRRYQILKGFQLDWQAVKQRHFDQSGIASAQ